MTEQEAEAWLPIVRWLNDSLPENKDKGSIERASDDGWWVDAYDDAGVHYVTNGGVLRQLGVRNVKGSLQEWQLLHALATGRDV